MRCTGNSRSFPQRRRRDRGQAALEFAIGLPVVAIAVLAIAQGAVLIRDQLALETAARTAARAASASTDTGASVAAGLASTGVTGIDIAIVESDSTVSATASRPAYGLPIVGLAVSGYTQEATVTMLIEPPSQG